MRAVPLRQRTSVAQHRLVVIKLRGGASLRAVMQSRGRVRVSVYMHEPMIEALLM